MKNFKLREQDYKALQDMSEKQVVDLENEIKGVVRGQAV